MLQMAVRGIVRSMHDEVDALDDGGWWEGRITQVGKQRYKVQPFISASLLTVKKTDVRTSVVWDGQGWTHRHAAGKLCVVHADSHLEACYIFWTHSVQYQAALSNNIRTLGHLQLQPCLQV